MTSLWQFIAAHPTTDTLVAYYVAISFVGSLPAPVASSSLFYVFCFRFANTLAGNLSRAYATKVEASPNFQAALNVQQKQAGQTQTLATEPPAEPPKP